jgi:hypothetical protein
VEVDGSTSTSISTSTSTSTSTSNPGSPSSSDSFGSQIASFLQRRATTVAAQRSALRSVTDLIEAQHKLPAQKPQRHLATLNTNQTGSTTTTVSDVGGRSMNLTIEAVPCGRRLYTHVYDEVEGCPIRCQRVVRDGFAVASVLKVSDFRMRGRALWAHYGSTTYPSFALNLPSPP